MNLFNPFKKRTDCIHLQTLGKQKGDILVSYITTPFSNQYNQIKGFHSNIWECKEIVRLWQLNGYNVDVINWNDTTFVPAKKYDYFLDIHSNIQRLAPLLNEECINILHITGSHWMFQNLAEYQRLANLKIRKGLCLSPRRQVVPTKGIELADYATMLGNDFTKSTYSFANKDIFQLSSSNIFDYPWDPDKNFQKTKTNFLWLGSSGMVHKGLDLVLEAFSELPDCNLSICGPVNNETDFFEAYKNDLNNSANIKNYNWVDVSSQNFRHIANQNCALIYPSCSEGQAGSVITAMHFGLIPIVSMQSGVDLGENGTILEKSSIDEILECITNFISLDPEEIKKSSKSVWEYVRKKYCKQAFSESYGEFLRSLSL